MCGINGIYSFSPQNFQSGVISAMNAASAFRGPDSTGNFEDMHVAFGHCRLSIIDPLPHSDQPFRSHDGRFTLVFNGEIYNFRELRNQLNDYNFATNGDVEVLLAAYMKWGEKCLDRFHGMFAFAIWDNVSNELFCARDRLGIKPFYYFLSDEIFVFSSSVKSILSTGLVSRKLNNDAFIDYLRYQTVHAPQTIVEQIFSLMPGTSVRLNESEGAIFRTWWQVSEHRQNVVGEYDQIKKEVRRLVTRSVERRLVADVPFGAFLSGGIDSSVIVSVMAELREQKTDTFSVVFREDNFSEAKYSRLIAQKYKTRHHEIELGAEEFKDAIPDALSLMDHPSGDGPNTYVVSKRTRAEGVKMALSGLGGDEIFCGYPVFRQIPSLQARKWLEGFPDFLRRPAGSLYHSIRRNTESAKIAEILRQPKFDLEFVYPFSRQVLLDRQIRNIVCNSSLPRNRVFEICKELIAYKTSGWKFQTLGRISLCEILTYMQNVLLRDADQMSMACGLEVRVPFLDHELVEYVLSVEDKHKQGICQKKLLVDSFSDRIPSEIYERKKMGFVLPYEHWMKTDLKNFCANYLSEVKQISTVSPEGIDQLWRSFQKGHVSWSRVWPLVVLGFWLKQTGING